MIDLHYWPTPNGHKITLLLEELAEAGAPLPYTLLPVNIGAGEQFRPEFLAIAPNNRMPAIVDHAPADGGAPLSVTAERGRAQGPVRALMASVAHSAPLYRARGCG